MVSLKYIKSKTGRIGWRTFNMYIIGLLYIFTGYCFIALNHSIPIPDVGKIKRTYSSKFSADTIIFLLLLIELFIVVVEIYLIRHIVKFIAKFTTLPPTMVSRSGKMARLLQEEFGASIFVGYIIFLFSHRLNEKLTYFSRKFYIHGEESYDFTSR